MAGKAILLHTRDDSSSDESEELSDAFKKGALMEPNSSSWLQVSPSRPGYLMSFAKLALFVVLFLAATGALVAITIDHQTSSAIKNGIVNTVAAVRDDESAITSGGSNKREVPDGKGDLMTEAAIRRSLYNRNQQASTKPNVSLSAPDDSKVDAADKGLVNGTSALLDKSSFSNQSFPDKPPTIIAINDKPITNDTSPEQIIGFSQGSRGNHSSLANGTTSSSTISDRVVNGISASASTQNETHEVSAGPPILFSVNGTAHAVMTQGLGNETMNVSIDADGGNAVKISVDDTAANTRNEEEVKSNSITSPKNATSWMKTADGAAEVLRTPEGGEGAINTTADEASLRNISESTTSSTANASTELIMDAQILNASLTSNETESLLNMSNIFQTRNSTFLWQNETFFIIWRQADALDEAGMAQSSANPNVSHVVSGKNSITNQWKFEEAESACSSAGPNVTMLTWQEDIHHAEGTERSLSLCSLIHQSIHMPRNSPNADDDDVMSAGMEEYQRGDVNLWLGGYSDHFDFGDGEGGTKFILNVELKTHSCRILSARQNETHGEAQALPFCVI